ncbi:hypothetical protein OIU79_026886 [Salix purpurea]|uniref:Uncharacterized protein n=1 Tax=Salix purpurea TaxID=77065 RepID=A0A9Q0VSF0_SALPP|nr:hypothetical protein OIU79_026886 [Salix purpurea]
MIRKKKEGRDSKARPHHTKGKRSRKEGKIKTHLLLTLLSLLARIREPSPSPVFSLPLRHQNPTEPQPQQPRPPPLPSFENIPAAGAREQPSSLLTRPSPTKKRRNRREKHSNLSRWLVLVLTIFIERRGHEACNPTPTRRSPGRKLTAGYSSWLERARHPPPAIQPGFACFGSAGCDGSRRWLRSEAMMWNFWI